MRGRGFTVICKCDYCGKEFKREYFKAQRVKHHFCNSKCEGKWKTGKNHPLYGKKHTEETRVKMSLVKIGKNNSRWNGGKTKDGNGYILVKNYDHPNCNTRGYIREHRIVMEKKLGRYLTKEEIIHHKNGVVDDNRIENLKLFANDIEHKKYHKFLRGKKKSLVLAF